MDDSGERLPRDSRPSEAGFTPRDLPDKSKQPLSVAKQSLAIPKRKNINYLFCPDEISRFTFAVNHTDVFRINQKNSVKEPLIVTRLIEEKRELIIIVLRISFYYCSNKIAYCIIPWYT